MTAAQLANLEKGRFKRGVASNPKGRPPNRVAALLKKVLPTKGRKSFDGLTADEVNTVERSLLSMREEDLVELKKSPETPFYMKALASALLSDMKAGRMTAADTLRSRQYGAVMQPVGVAVTTLALEEIDEELERLRRLDAMASGYDRAEEDDAWLRRPNSAVANGAGREEAVANGAGREEE